jgi:hypothetical protein
MSSTIFTPIAELIADAALAAIDELSNAHAKDPGMAGLGRLPALVVGLPTLRRTGVEGSESEVGRDDYRITFPVNVYVDLNNAPRAAEDAVVLLEQLVAVIDDPDTWDPDPAVIDFKLTVAEPVEILDEARPLLSYECRVELLKLVAAA